MMQNGGRTSKFGGRCEQFCFWSMPLIFVMVLDENDVFGQNAFAIRISGLQMPFCDFWCMPTFGREPHRSLSTLFACLSTTGCA